MCVNRLHSSMCNINNHLDLLMNFTPILIFSVSATTCLRKIIWFFNSKMLKLVSFLLRICIMWAFFTAAEYTHQCCWVQRKWTKTLNLWAKKLYEVKDAYAPQVSYHTIIWATDNTSKKQQKKYQYLVVQIFLNIVRVSHSFFPSKSSLIWTSCKYIINLVFYKTHFLLIKIGQVQNITNIQSTLYLTV